MKALILIAIALGIALLAFQQFNISLKPERVSTIAPEREPQPEPEPEPAHELVGTWESATDKMTLHADGTVTSPQLTGDYSQVVIQWYTVDFEEPKQFYIVLKAEDGRSVKMGSIYKIVDDKLYMRDEQVFERTINGFSTGQVTRTEMPTDFSADVTMYRKQ